MPRGEKGARLRNFETLLITGGAGFIGSTLIRYLFERPEFQGRIVNLDALRYAGRLENLKGIPEKYGERYRFVRADIADESAVREIFSAQHIDGVVHCAAESHVDRSIRDPGIFIRSNVLGTQVLLEAARRAWEGRKGVLFHHVSTDEVFGPLPPGERAREGSPYAPSSPYAASKAASDHLVRAYAATYGLPVTITNCSNNYGSGQFPEKFIPLMIRAMLEGRTLPIYGDGRQVRDWLYVEDHVEAIWKVMREGRLGETYLVGSGVETENLALLEGLIALISERAGKDPAELRALIRHVPDRPGHDRRYALDSGKIRAELGWSPRVGLEEGLRKTVEGESADPFFGERTTIND